MKERAFVTVVEDAKAAGLPVVARLAPVRLAWFYALQGRLRRAVPIYEEARRVLSLAVVTGVPAYCFGFGELLREWNELDEAERLLAQGVAAIIDNSTVVPHVVVDGYIALARLRQARGDDRAAVAVLGEFASLARQRDFPEWVVARAAAARAHLWLIQGSLAAAAHWADASGCAFDDELDYLHELEHLVLARVGIAQRQQPALALLDRLLADAEAVGRMGSAVPLVVRAVGRQTFGDRTGARADLERALALGEPEGYIRVFADEGLPMAALLRDAHTRGIAPEYVATLLAVLGPRPGESGRTESVSSSRRSDVRDVLVEALTERERAILRCVVAGASNQEIASNLFLATSTVKWHIHHVFGKLGVRSRTQAIARARALNLE